MDADHPPPVEALFAARPSRSAHPAVALEHELLTADVATGAAVPVDRVRAAVDGGSYAPYVAFEPGGQVELLALRPRRARPGAPGTRGPRRARAGCLAAGIRLDRARSTDGPSPRCRCSWTHRGTSPCSGTSTRIGPAGRRMMRRTASTQVCLDWWAGGAGLEQWRLLNLAGPFLAAAFARPGSDRLLTWLAVDPSRTAFDGRLLRGDDPVSAYADFAAAATPIVAAGGST